MAWHSVAQIQGIRIISCIDSNNYVMKNVCSIKYLDGISQTAKWWCTWSRNILLQHNAIVIAVVVVIRMHRVRDVICSTECVCVWICSMCVCVYVPLSSLLYTCGVRCHIHEHTKTRMQLHRRQANVRTGGRPNEPTNKMNEHTKTNDSNALFRVRLTQTKFQTENISMRGTFLVCRHSLFNVSFRGYCLFICLFAC